jgi:hypothetical protein
MFSSILSLYRFFTQIYLTDLNYFIKLVFKCCDNSASFLCSEPGHVRCVGLLPGDEELHHKEALEEQSGKHQVLFGKLVTLSLLRTYSFSH